MAIVSSWRDWLLLKVLGPGPQVLSLRILVHTLVDCIFPPSLFRDGCVTLMCMASLTPRLNHLGSTSKKFYVIHRYTVIWVVRMYMMRYFRCDRARPPMFKQTERSLKQCFLLNQGASTMWVVPVFFRNSARSGCWENLSLFTSSKDDVAFVIKCA